MRICRLRRLETSGSALHWQNVQVSSFGVVRGYPSIRTVFDADLPFYGKAKGVEESNGPA